MRCHMDPAGPRLLSHSSVLLPPKYLPAPEWEAGVTVPPQWTQRRGHPCCMMLRAVVGGGPGYWEGIEIVFLIQKADSGKKTSWHLQGKFLLDLGVSGAKVLKNRQKLFVSLSVAITTVQLTLTAQ